MITRLVLLVYHVLWREDRARFLGSFLLEAFAVISTTQQVQVDQCLLCHKYLVKCHQLIYKETSFLYSIGLPTCTVHQSKEDCTVHKYKFSI